MPSTPRLTHDQTLKDLIGKGQQPRNTQQAAKPNQTQPAPAQPPCSAVPAWSRPPCAPAAQTRAHPPAADPGSPGQTPEGDCTTKNEQGRQQIRTSTLRRRRGGRRTLNIDYAGGPQPVTPQFPGTFKPSQDKWNQISSSSSSSSPPRCRAPPCTSSTCRARTRHRNRGARPGRAPRPPAAAPLGTSPAVHPQYICSTFAVRLQYGTASSQDAGKAMNG